MVISVELERKGFGSTLNDKGLTVFDTTGRARQVVRSDSKSRHRRNGNAIAIDNGCQFERFAQLNDRLAKQGFDLVVAQYATRKSSPFLSVDGIVNRVSNLIRRCAHGDRHWNDRRGRSGCVEIKLECDLTTNSVVNRELSTICHRSRFTEIRAVYDETDVRALNLNFRVNNLRRERIGEKTRRNGCVDRAQCA